MEGEGGMGLAYLDMLFSGVDPAMVGHGRPWLTMVSHGRPWLAMADHGRSWPALELPADPQHVIHLICWNYLIWLAPTLCSLGGWVMEEGPYEQGTKTDENRTKTRRKPGLVDFYEIHIFPHKN